MDVVKDEDVALEELNDALRKIGTRDVEITEFEKIYVLASSDSIGENGIDEKQINSVTNLAQYLIDNKGAKLTKLSPEEEKEIAEVQRMLEGIGRNDIQNSLVNYYMVKQDVPENVRQSNENDKKKYGNMYKLLDTDGYGMYIVDGNGNTQITSTLKNEIQKYLETHYKTALEQKKISADEVEETLNPGSVEEVSILLSQSNLYIRNINRVIDKLVDEKNLEQGLDDDKKILKDDEISLSNGTIQSDKELEAINDREKEDDGIKTSNDNVNDKNLPSGQKESSMQKTNDGQDKVKEEELPPEEKDVKEEIENAGIEESAIERIARENRVRPTQVNIRILGTRAAMDYVEELTGANLKSYRDEEVMVVRIPRVAENDLLYIADSRTGERIEIRGREHERTIADAEQVMKYRWRPGLDTIQPMKAPSEKEGQLTYMSYIDRNGTSKEARYINNGKVVDVDKERRDAYLKEVAIATKELKEAIEAHEKNPDSFTHKRVVAAMKARVNVDREFGVLSQQKKVTELSVENARKIVEDEDHAKINDSVHDEGRSIWDGPSHYFG